jgi:enoyl-CoA hydratase
MEFFRPQIFSTPRPPSERTDLPAFYNVVARSLPRSPGIESICDNLGYKAVVEDRRAETTMRQTAGRLTRFPRRLRLLKGRGRAQMEVVKPNAREPGHIGLHVGAGVAVITLRRSGKMNALNEEMWTALLEAVRKASRDEKVRVLVIRGEGDHFSTGADLKELGRVSLPQAEDIFHQMEECVATIEESPLPTLACIRGYALGTGLEMALACDLRIADESAVLGMPIARLGITLSDPFVKRLVALIGPARTKDLVYTGRLVDASEALRWGLVDRVAGEDKSVVHETLQLASVIRHQSAASIRVAKSWAGSGSGRVPAKYNYVDAEDFPEGVAAFLERRPPQFYQMVTDTQQ